MIPALILAAVGFEVGTSVMRQQTRRKRFQAAREHARGLGRDLVVIGCPTSGLHSRIAPVYDHGDLTVDLHPCANARCHCGDITEPGALRVQDDSAVVYISCVMEYIAIEKRTLAIREILRAAGSPANVFNVPVGPSIVGYFIPGAGSFDSRPACTEQR